MMKKWIAVAFVLGFGIGGVGGALFFSPSVAGQTGQIAAVDSMAKKDRQIPVVDKKIFKKSNGNLLPEWVQKDLASCGLTGIPTKKEWERFIGQMERNGVHRFEEKLGHSLALDIAKSRSIPTDPFIKEIIAEQINTPDQFGRTPLANAARYGTPDTLSALVNMGADLFQITTDRSGREMDVLNYALQSNSIYHDVNIIYLLDNGFSPGPAEQYFFDLFQNETSKRLILPQMVAEMDVNTSLPSGMSALAFGLQNGMAPEIVDAFLDRGPDLRNTSSDRGEVLRMGCANRGLRPDQVERMIAMGADVNGVAEKGNFTPLHGAVLNRRPDLVRIFLEHGANPDVADIMGRTPSQILDKMEANSPEEREDIEAMRHLFATMGP